jgi:hypothetical protein
MRDLYLRTPSVGERISQTYLRSIEKMAANSPSPGIGTVGRWLSATASGYPASTFKIYTCSLTADLLPGSSASATLLTGTSKTTNGGSITVYDTPSSITAGKKIASGVKCRIFKDHDMILSEDEYVFLLPFSCEVDQ